MQAYLQLLQLLRRPVTDSNRALQQNRRHRPWYRQQKGTLRCQYSRVSRCFGRRLLTSGHKLKHVLHQLRTLGLCKASSRGGELDLSTCRVFQNIIKQILWGRKWGKCSIPSSKQKGLVYKPNSHHGPNAASLPPSSSQYRPSSKPA